MFTTSFRDDILLTLPGFIGLFKSVTDFRAGTVVEADYTGYGTRPAIAYTAAANTTPTMGRQKTNNAIISFPQNTGATQDVIGWGLWSAATAGSLKVIGFLDADPPVLGTGAATGDLVTSVAHGLQTDQRVLVLAAPGSGIPTGLSENVAYFVLAAGLTADVFALSTTSGGAAVDITTGGAAMFMPYKALTIANLATPTVAANAIIVQV